MPIYEYHCDRCDHEFEKLVFNSSEKISCPKCKGKKVNRMMSAFDPKIAGRRLAVGRLAGDRSRVPDLLRNRLGLREQQQVT